MRHSLLALLFAAQLATPVAWAADPVTDAIQAAYPPYRAALFRTNGKSQSDAERAVADATKAWQGVVDRFAAGAPVPYAGDAKFGATLADVAAVYREAEPLVRAGKLPDAHEVLERVRDLIAGLRLRNGVVVFSDHMNAYHEEMEHVLAEGPKVLAEPQGTMQLMARVGALELLAARLKSQAPAALQANDEFGAGLKAVADSVAALRRATLAQDPAAIQQAIGALKGPYSRLFLKFG